LDFVSFSETGWPKEAGRDEPDSIDEELGIVDVFVEVGSDYHVKLTTETYLALSLIIQLKL